LSRSFRPSNQRQAAFPLPSNSTLAPNAPHKDSSTKKLEQHHRIQRRTTVVCPAKMPHPATDKSKIDLSIGIPQKVTFGHQFT
jgi:hypothetical protein